MAIPQGDKARQAATPYRPMHAHRATLALRPPGLDELQARCATHRREGPGMSKPPKGVNVRIKPADNASNQTNPNIDSKGTNLQYDQVHGNRGKQLNPNQHGTYAEDEDIDQGDVYWYDSNGD